MFEKWMKDYKREYKKEDEIKFKIDDPELMEEDSRAERAEEPVLPKTDIRTEAEGGAMKLKMQYPKKFEDVSTIADFFLEGYTVVMNTDGLDPVTLRRMYDFLNGVTYSRDGVINRVDDTGTFILSPSDVDVSGEKKN